MEEHLIKFFDKKVEEYINDQNRKEQLSKEATRSCGEEEASRAKNERNLLHIKIKKALGTEVDAEFILILHHLRDSLLHNTYRLPPSSEIKASLEKFNDAIESMMPFLDWLHSEYTWILNKKMRQEISFFSTAIYTHILLSTLRKHIKALVHEMPDSKRGRKNNTFYEHSRGYLLAYVYEYVSKIYQPQVMEKREKESLIRGKTAEILHICHVHIPGADLTTKGSKDRFWKEIKKGVKIKKDQDEDFQKRYKELGYASDYEDDDFPLD